MAELEFSITPAELGDLYDELQMALAEFEARTRIQVRLRPIVSKVALDELTKFAIYKKGPDVSQIGSTWLEGLADMDALRPFGAEEVKTLGDPADFVPASWKSVTLLGQPEMWAVPWLADALAATWGEVLETSAPNWDAILDDRLNRLARQLSLTLG